MDKAILEKKNLFSLFLYGARIKTLTASAYPVILGMVLARYEGFYDLFTYLCTIFTAIFLQAGCNFANDYFDDKSGRDKKDRLGPVRLCGSNLIDKKIVFLFMTLCFVFSALACYPLIVKGGKVIVMLLLLGIFFAIFYSKGKYSLANTGLASPVVFIVFGPLATAFCYFFQTGFFSMKTLLFGAIPGSLAMMLFAMNNLRDFIEDKKSGKKTLVVRFGFSYGKKEFLCFLLLSWIIPPITAIVYSAPLITLLPLITMFEGKKIIQMLVKAKDSNDIIALFPKTAKYNIFYGLLSIIGWRIATL